MAASPDDRAADDEPPGRADVAARGAPRGARAWTLAGAVLAAASLVLAPILLGPLAMATATLGHVRGDPWGIRVAVIAGVAMVASMALQALLFGSGGVAA